MCQDRRERQDAPPRRLPPSEQVRGKRPEGTTCRSGAPWVLLRAAGGCRGLALPLTPQEPLTQAATPSRPVNREPVQSPTLGGLWTLNPRQGNRSAEAASQQQASCSQTLNRGLSQHLRERGWSRPQALPAPVKAGAHERGPPAQGRGLIRGPACVSEGRGPGAGGRRVLAGEGLAASLS